MKIIVVLFIVMSLPVFAATDSSSWLAKESIGKHILLTPVPDEVIPKSIIEISQKFENMAALKVETKSYSKWIKPKSRFELANSTDVNLIGLEQFRFNEVFHMERFRTPALRIRI